MAYEPMMPTRVVNVGKRQTHDVYIGRGSIWGNPFKIGVDGTREEVIQKYAEYYRNNSELQKRIHELRGQRLGCFCAPKSCHGHFLAAMADKKVEDQMNPK